MYSILIKYLYQKNNKNKKLRLNANMPVDNFDMRKYKFTKIRILNVLKKTHNRVRFNCKHIQSARIQH